ncbi:Calcineurin-like phosphoesterase domain, apaH type [Trema orientale]|uniref:Calcineurin-like phosphoesterase domain, apaH type n=1 Tax=Trema orientale TaxID=63057 RepID=A0A2P5DY84_TREOI|nr:Calcineurin-like phosphoesterase domain, apaH type [Trema orientale]
MKQRELTGLLCVIWAASLLYGEMVAYWLPSLWSCSWPHLHRPNSTVDGARYPGDYVKIAVITDPQLMDKTSLNLAPKSLALEMAQFYTDLYMRRAFLSSIMPLKPDVILYLGDYFDGGPYLSDEEWQESLNRFKHIFYLETQGKHRDIKVYFLPGNHDIGYESVHIHNTRVVNRYEHEFGKRNYRFTAGKVEFIAVDAQTLDAHHQENQASSSLEFVKNVSMDVQSYPRVLLTHIPLYRRDWTYCGPNRNSPVINQRILRTTDGEIRYQNYVSEESSDFLLELLKPVLILSGHDHDQCTLTHKSTSGPVMEHTVGTISWQQGNLYPSFMLLSASNIVLSNTSSAAVSTQLCYLPMQTFIYIWYLVLFIFTLLALLLWPTSSVSCWHHLSDLAGYGKQMLSGLLSATKEKNEDLDCEYEMIWDAEGSMHLVKKPSNTSPSVKRLTEMNPERGSAVIRPTARKNISPESDISLSVDNNGDIGLDYMTKLPPRGTRSWRKIVIQRLLRTFLMLSIIAAVNVTLYMILLFKDWIDQ